MFKPRFLIGWIVGSALMFLCFYLFHGVLTNDFSKSGKVNKYFFEGAALAYIVTGYLIGMLLSLSFLKSWISNQAIRSLGVGCFCGMLVFGITTISGQSLSGKPNMVNMAVDLCWQILEQSVGSFTFTFFSLNFRGSHIGDNDAL